MGLPLRESSYGWDQLIKDVCLAMGKLTGNIMGEKQLPMVESRIRRRCLELRIESPWDYKVYWDKNAESENKHLIGLITTHFTSFFREFAHFEWIAQELPNMIRHARAEGRDTLHFWSSACSKGQEVWSLCMWLQIHVPKLDARMKWKVLGTDIDISSVGPEV